MLPGTYNLELYRGDTYTWRFILWDDVAMTDTTDLTGAAADAEIRNKTAGTQIVALTCAITAPNIIDVTLDADQWVDIPTKGVWDLQVTFPGDVVHTVVRGAVTTIGDVVDSVAAPVTDLTPAVVVVNTDTGATTTIELDAGMTETIDVVVPAAVAPVIEVFTGGAPVRPGIVIDDEPPADTGVLWADTTETGGGDTIQVFVYTDETDVRPAATVVFWIPDPFDLPNPYGAMPGDLVLRSTPDMVAGLNGVEKIWKGTAAELAALTPDDDTIYFVYEPEIP